MSLETRPGLEHKRKPEALPFRKKAGLFISRLGLAAICTVPVADFALSDGVSAKVLQISQDKISMESETLERTTEMGVVAADIMIESTGVGIWLSRRKRIRNVFNEYDEYREEKQKFMNPLRRFSSKIADLPYKGLEKLGSGIEKLGEKAAQRKSKVARATGKFLIDTAQVNIIGTNGVVMRETMAGKPPTIARNAELAGLITFTWIGLAELVRGIYRNVDFARPSMAAIGEAFTELTSPDIASPLNTPTATAFLGTTALLLAAKGWDIAKYHEQRQPVETTPVA